MTPSERRELAATRMVCASLRREIQNSGFCKVSISHDNDNLICRVEWLNNWQQTEHYSMAWTLGSEPTATTMIRTTIAAAKRVHKL